LKGIQVRETPLLGQRAIAVVIGLYIVLVLAASLHFGISLTADRVVVLIVVAALGTGRVRSFLRDWSAFLLVVLAWQVLQGMSHTVAHLKPHVTEMIVIDKFLFFGHIPSLWLQQHLYHPGSIAWYDVVATVLYMLHFIFPLGVAFALWFFRREVFGEYITSFMILALTGFATFVLFPAAPPWIAANWWHYFPHITKIFDVGITVFGKQSYSALTTWAWQHGGWDYFGAVPSEHAAFPFLGFLYARKAWRRGGWVVLPYCFAVWFAVVYLGEHYVTDVLVGVVYATLAYVAVQLLVARRERSAQKVSQTEERVGQYQESNEQTSESVPA